MHRRFAYDFVNNTDPTVTAMSDIRIKTMGIAEFMGFFLNYQKNTMPTVKPRGWGVATGVILLWCIGVCVACVLVYRSRMGRCYSHSPSVSPIEERIRRHNAFYTSELTAAAQEAEACWNQAEPPSSDLETCFENTWGAGSFETLNRMFRTRTLDW